MKRSLVMLAAAALPLVGLTATPAEAAPGYLTVVKANIQYKAGESGERLLLCPGNEIGTPPDGGDEYDLDHVRGTAEVSATFVPKRPGSGTIGGVLVTFDNTDGTKGGKIRAVLYCDED